MKNVLLALATLLFFWLISFGYQWYNIVQAKEREYKRKKERQADEVFQLRLHRMLTDTTSYHYRMKTYGKGQFVP